MSLARCIPDMVKRGEIDAPRAARMRALFDELDAHYRQTMGPDAAAAEASEATLRQLASEARLKKRQAILQANRQLEAVKDTERFTGDSPYAAIDALLDDDDRAPYRGGNVTFRARAIEFDAQARMQDFILRHRRDLAGKPRDVSGLNDTVRELHGQATGNAAAKVAAEAIADTFERLRQRFNAAGGAIRKLDGYGLSHSHDALKVRAAGRDGWIDAIMPLLDRGKMIDDATGAPFGDDKLRAFLGQVWKTIKAGGLTGEASGAIRGGKVANRRQDHRVLHFRDGDAWLDYSAQFGTTASPFEAVMGHVAGMAKDIAMMERLGPNPAQAMRYLLDRADKLDEQTDKAVPGAVVGIAAGRVRTERLWRYVNGDGSVPVVPDSRWGERAVRTSQGTRNLLVASRLGSATITASTDAVFGTQARQFYGVAAGKFALLPEIQTAMGYLNQLRPSQRRLAERLAAGMEDATQTMRGLRRFYEEASGPGWTSVMSDGVLRLSGLNKWTEAGQRAMVLDTLAELGARRGAAFDKLPGELRGALERSGIDSADWDAIRQAPPMMDGRTAYVDPAAVRAQAVMGAGPAAERLEGFVLRARAGAVIETSATSRAMMTFGQNPGTWQGEAIRSIAQFKGFVAAFMFKQARMMSAMTPGQRAQVAARFFIALTAAGAITIQAKELAKGNDPRPMDTGEFWTDAALQSGGVGIFGDLIGAFNNDRIGGLGELAAGPIGGLFNDVWQAKETALPGKERKDGTRREANPGGAAVRLARRNLPGTNLWYLRAAFDNMVFDQLDAELNPYHADAVARADRRRRDNEQGAWWGEDGLTPARMPDWGNAVPERDADGARVAE